MSLLYIHYRLELSRYSLNSAALKVTFCSCSCFLSYSGMASFITLTLIAVLALGCEGSPLSHSQRGTEEVERRGLHLAPAAPDRLETDLQPRTGRTQRLAEDQREVISKQILQALSEIIQREDCISDYQGWVDFGRRSTD